MIATSGRKCLEQYGRLPRATLWGKTFMDLLIGTGDWFSTRCKLTWKLKGTKYNRLYFQLVPSTHHTEEIGSGLLPTVVASDATTGAIIGKNDTFITTSTGMPRKINQNGTNGSVGLARLGKLEMLPTPTTRDFKGARTDESLKKAGRNKTNSLPDYFNQSGKSSQLNPQFVAEMMGFPTNWTELPFLSGDKNQ